MNSPLSPTPCEKCREDIHDHQVVHLCTECWDEIDNQKDNDKTKPEKKQMDIKQIAVQVENNTKATLAILEALIDRQSFCRG